MAIYFVSPLAGNDANDGLTFATAWATTQKAADTAVIGDEVRLCASATEVPTVTTDWDTNAGDITRRIRFIAYNATGTEILKNGYYTISGASLASNVHIWTMGTSAVIGLEFYGIRLTGATGSGQAIYFGTINTNFESVFHRCKFDNCQSGVSGTRGRAAQYINCEFNDNRVIGMGSVGSSSGAGTNFLDDCRIYNNGNNGIESPAALHMNNCVVYNNGGDNVRIRMFSSAECWIRNSTIDGADGDGVQIRGTASSLTIVNTNISNSSGLGVNVAANAYSSCLIEHTNFFGNVSGAYGVAAVTVSGQFYIYSLISGNPQFTDASAGNYTPLSTSPLIGSGTRGRVIGAWEPSGLTSGGSVLPPPTGIVYVLFSTT